MYLRLRKTPTGAGSGRFFRPAIVTFIILLLTSTTLSNTQARRIRFKKGHISSRVKGYLSHVKDEANFVLWARAGQRMLLRIDGKGPTRGVVIFPSGKQEGGPGGVIFDGTLPETGDYRIRVTESTMADEWKGRFILEVTIR